MCFFVRTYFVFNINDGKQTRCYTGSYWSRVYQSIFPIECVLTTKFVFTWVKFLFIHNVLWLIQSCFFFRNLLLAFLLLISSFFCFVKFFYIFCCYLYREKLKINKRAHLKVSGMYYFSHLTDITSNMCTFCFHLCFNWTSCLCCCNTCCAHTQWWDVSLALLTPAKGWQNTLSMPWSILKMIIKISGDICVSCTKTHSFGHTAFKKLFNFENNNCIHNR